MCTLNIIAWIAIFFKYHISKIIEKQKIDMAITENILINILFLLFNYCVSMSLDDTRSAIVIQ